MSKIMTPEIKRLLECADRSARHLIDVASSPHGKITVEQADAIYEVGTGTLEAIDDVLYPDDASRARSVVERMTTDANYNEKEVSAITTMIDTASQQRDAA